VPRATWNSTLNIARWKKKAAGGERVCAALFAAAALLLIYYWFTTDLLLSYHCFTRGGNAYVPLVSLQLLYYCFTTTLLLICNCFPAALLMQVQNAGGELLFTAAVCCRMLTYADVCWRMQAQNAGGEHLFTARVFQQRGLWWHLAR
jgi:hypothetical protein